MVLELIDERGNRVECSINQTLHFPIVFRVHHILLLIAWLLYCDNKEWQVLLHLDLIIFHAHLFRAPHNVFGAHIVGARKR